MAGERLWIIGPGRVGLAIGLLLHRAGAVESLVYTGRSDDPPPHPLFAQNPPATYLTRWTVPDPLPTAILIAVPDAAIEEVASRLAELQIPPGVPVLHTSGVRSSEALARLADLGVPVGSLHPLTAVARPETGADRLAGGWFAVEGDAGALRVAGWIGAAASARVLEVPRGGKALYHAAAVLASNYVVTLLSMAETLAVRAGLQQAEARAALATLAAGAARNVERDGPESALTGPIARGDAGTVSRHLAELSGQEAALYSVLGRETLALARRAGLPPHDAARLERMLGGEAE